MIRTASSYAPTLLSVLLLGACANFPPEQAPVTPQRPTLSSDTNTTGKGTLEVEAGTIVDPGDAWQLATTTKFGITDHAEMFASWSPWVHVDPSFDGAGDLALGVRQRISDETENDPSVAIQVTAKLPTGGREVSTGETDLFFAGIASKQLGVVSGTVFYQLGLLGDPSGRGTELQHDLALAMGAAIDERWGGFGELSGTFVTDADYSGVFARGGLTYAASESMVFDGGLALGLSDDAEDLTILLGFTHNLGVVRRWFD